MSNADDDQRLRCLVDFDSLLVVEAAAGVGKTSLMAARVAMMLAAGVRPSEIAAITFTEPAASELTRRIHQFVEDLLEGKIPTELEIALPGGLSEAQRAALSAAASSLDELTSCTIHSFCLAIISDHAVDVERDPGAKVADEFVAEAMFDQAFEAWLLGALSSDDPADQAVLVLAEDDPLGVVSRLRELAELRNRYRDAKPLEPDASLRPDIVFVEAIDAFDRWTANHPQDRPTTEFSQQFQQLRQHFFACLAGHTDFNSLWRLGQPPRLDLMLRNSYAFREYRRLGAWKKALGEQGELVNAEALSLYQAVELSFADLLGYIASRMVSTLSGSLQRALDIYGGLKRQAAVMDFDDLLELARDVLLAHKDARRTVANRYRYIAVDEFQDTDTLQCEILFTIASAERVNDWRNASLRPGSLFLVGDPKQSIYRFRKADIVAYQAARDVMLRQPNGALVEITANFRSRRPILDFVNSRFGAVFNGQEQPRYVPLTATVIDQSEDTRQAVAKLTVFEEASSPTALRQAEATAIAHLCKDLIGRFPVRRRNGVLSPAHAGDIALLAPSHTDLWRYERELESLQISVASQAGKALMRRQETQDVLALLRSLSDPTDRLAFGALLRGPLVGLTDHEIADLAAGVGGEGDDATRFGLLADVGSVADTYARSVIAHLQSLYRRSHVTTPSQLLSEAIETLGARLVISARHANRNARALANIDALADRAGRYAVSGLKSFVRDLQVQWERSEPVQEGRSDSAENAVHIVTMHSAKGLEWPIVIPIAGATQFRPAPQFVHRRGDNSLHWVLGNLAPPALAQARVEEDRLQAKERERMIYVVSTRARDLVVFPYMPTADAKSWSRVVPLDYDRLPEIDLTELPAETGKQEVVENPQSADRFSEEVAVITASSPPMVWHRPSAHDETIAVEVANDAPDFVGTSVPLGAGRIRGTTLHKLMEELITGELAVDRETVLERASFLLRQLLSVELEVAELPSATEMTDTALATLAIPDIAALYPVLEAEVPVWGVEGTEYVAARADAIAVVEGSIAGVIDWKSDVMPTATARAQYSAQVDHYIRTTGALAGAVVFLTTGEVVWRGDRLALLSLAVPSR